MKRREFNKIAGLSTLTFALGGPVFSSPGPVIDKSVTLSECNLDELQRLANEYEPIAMTELLKSPLINEIDQDTKNAIFFSKEVASSCDCPVDKVYEEINGELHIRKALINYLLSIMLTNIQHKILGPHNNVVVPNEFVHIKDNIYTGKQKTIDVPPNTPVFIDKIQIFADPCLFEHKRVGFYCFTEIRLNV